MELEKLNIFITNIGKVKRRVLWNLTHCINQFAKNEGARPFTSTEHEHHDSTMLYNLIYNIQMLNVH